MSFTTVYGLNVKLDAGLAAEKRWKTEIIRLPTTAAATGNVGAVTTGPLGTGGSADAMYFHGDGTSTGYASPLDAVQRALVFLENDRALNGDSN